MTKKSLLSALLILSFVAACAEKKQLEQMHDNTAEMKDTTVKMEANMTDLKAKTGQMKEVTDELYDALRQGNSVQLRREAWKSILASPTMFRKISEAGKYFMSYEMQIWNLTGQDMEAGKRDILIQQAAQEFFLEIEELAPRAGIDVTAEPNGADVNSVANRTASFNALALAMSEINRKQLPVLQTRPELEKISMMSVMEEALLAKKSLNEGTANLGTKAGYVREILVHEAKAIQILQTQYNLFPLIFIDQATGINDKYWFSKLNMMVRGWDFEMDKLNSEQLAYLQEKVLAQSLHAKALLKKLGIKPELDWKVGKLLKAMRVKGVKKVSVQDTAGRANLLDQISQIQAP